MANIKYCVKCGNIKFLTYDEPETCKYCGTLLSETRYTWEDSLQQGDTTIISIIENEYILNNPKSSPEAKQKRIEQDRIDGIYQTLHASSTSVKCPYCQSEDVKKISVAGRAASVGLFGLTSKKIGKQWHCNRCKSDF